MYALKRIIAYLIDSAIVLWLAGQTGSFLARLLLSGEPNPARVALYSYAMMAASGAVPIVVIGALSGGLGWTPGKLVLFLRVKDARGAAPGVSQGILREIIKYVSFSFFFLGALIALYGIVTSQRAFYDDWLGIEVDDLKPSGLTETQKKWREFQREQCRKS